MLKLGSIPGSPGSYHAVALDGSATIATAKSRRERIVVMKIIAGKLIVVGGGVRWIEWQKKKKAEPQRKRLPRGKIMGCMTLNNLAGEQLGTKRGGGKIHRNVE